MTDASILLNAAHLIREHGHCKRNYRDAQGRYCVLGALQEPVAGYSSDRYPALVRLADYLRLSGVRELMHWNDAPKRTKKQVIAALEGAAKCSLIENAYEELLLLEFGNSRYKLQPVLCALRNELARLSGHTPEFIQNEYAVVQ